MASKDEETLNRTTRRGRYYNVKDTSFIIRISPGHLQLIKEAAEHAGMSVSAFFRVSTLAAARGPVVRTRRYTEVPVPRDGRSL
jgi:hypothetical protein